MKISCIIPTCNRNNFLIEAINSVLKQTLLPDEIIIVNNGEKAVMLPDEMAGKVKIYNIIPYAGASQARNFGASLANGDFLAFLDDDDLWNSDYLRSAISALEKGADCTVSRVDKMVGGKVLQFKNAHGCLTIKNLFSHNPGVTGSNIILSKSIFFNCGGFDPKLKTSEDKSLLVELIRKKTNIRTLPNNQVIRRIHNQGSLTAPDKISEGIFQFIFKYKKLMGRKDYLFNLLKIYKYFYKSGDKFAGIKYLFLKIAFSFLSIFNSNKS